MNRIFNTNYNFRSLDFVLFVLRAGVALLMLTHGLPKLNTLLSGGEIQFPDPIGLGAAAALSLAVFAEVFCSIFVLMGLGTRLAVIPLMITMLVAIFVIHAEDGLDKMELGIHYLLAYVVLFVAGSGKISFDYLISRKLTRARRSF